LAPASSSTRSTSGLGIVSFGKDGETLVIPHGGGTKKTQDRDIATAHERWQDYKKRKTEEK
jgi:putative component of toxin-antitoxin plasmid stabilization module